MADNPFGDDAPVPPRVDPFGEESRSGGPAEAAAAIDHAAARIRRLKSQVGSDGLTLAATRELIEQIDAALEATARALRGLE